GPLLGGRINDHVLEDYVQSRFRATGDDGCRRAELNDVAMIVMQPVEPLLIERQAVVDLKSFASLGDLARQPDDEPVSHIDGTAGSELLDALGVAHSPHRPVAGLWISRDGADIDELPCAGIRETANNGVEVFAHWVT